MNIKKKIYIKGKDWCPSRFEIHYVPYMLGGVLYAGFTIFGISILYSDCWHVEG